MQETYKNILGYEGSYQISNLGNLFSFKSMKVLKPDISNQGYKRVTLSSNTSIKRFLIHRLVAQAFINNPDNKLYINHIDNNPNNNRIDNLEWCTHSENMIHGHQQDRLANLKASEQAVVVNQTRHSKLYKERLGDRFIAYYSPTLLDQTGRKKVSSSAIEYICNSCGVTRIGLADWKELREHEGICPNCQTQVSFLEEDIV